MGIKVRKQIYIEPYQEKLLKEMAQQSGTSEAELIRQAIDRHLRGFASTRPSLDAWEKEKAFIAEIQKRVPLPGGRDWNRTDLHER
ncbi:CopG family transcriptional regulator [Gloeobacter violaceus]|nr:CopG family transcriptional regulator [Gloeobacter violaceus]